MVKILWVDDEVELLKPHVLFLRGKGYEVETCNNGYDAIDMAAEGAYDLIILDEMMPGMTGLETLPKIKEVRPTTPVIMVTKSEEENIMDKAVGSKIADYLIKPRTPTRYCSRSRNTSTRNSSSPNRPRPTTARNSAASPNRSRWPTPLRTGARSTDGSRRGKSNWKIRPTAASKKC